MRDYTKQSRIAQLKAMHELMKLVNDEDIYMAWIYIMPDEPSDADFENIAEDEEEYLECFNVFRRLMQKKGNEY